MEAVIGHKQSHLLENNHLELYTYQKWLVSKGDENSIKALMEASSQPR